MNKKAFRDDFQCDQMTANEIQHFEEFQMKIGFLKKARYLRQRIINCQDTESLIELKESGLFKFAESVLSDPTHTFDVKTMRDLLSQNKFMPGNFNIAPIFISCLFISEPISVIFSKSKTANYLRVHLSES